MGGAALALLVALAAGSAAASAPGRAPFAAGDGSGAAELEDAPPPTAEQVLAEVVRRLTGFVAWPPREEADTEFQVCVAADPPMEAALQRMVRKAGQLNELPARVRRIQTSDEAAGCRVLWVGPGQEATARKVSERGGARGTLVVSATQAHCGAGAHIVLVQRSKGFEVLVDRDGCRRGRFGISSKLLRLARFCR